MLHSGPWRPFVLDIVGPDQAASQERVAALGAGS
jgi:hypothetical protein